jgi:iron-sulfur cluster assembly protein
MTITLSDVAASQLLSLLEEKDLPNHGLRIFVQGGGCAGLQYGMAYEDAAREGDTVIESQGVRLFVDGYSSLLLDGATIDYEDGLMGAGFRVHNPNALASCACGTSFRTEGDTQVETTCAT